MEPHAQQGNVQAGIEEYAEVAFWRGMDRGKEGVKSLSLALSFLPPSLPPSLPLSRALTHTHTHTHTHARTHAHAQVSAVMGIFLDACRDVATCASCLRAACGELLNRRVCTVLTVE